MHLRRFYGIFAPNHGLRAHIAPTPPDRASTTAPVAPERPKSMPWAHLLMPRSCAPETRFVDALRCPHCGGRMRVICAIGDPDAITADTEPRRQSTRTRGPMAPAIRSQSAGATHPRRLSGPSAAREATANRPNAEVRLPHDRPAEARPRTPRQRPVYRVQTLERCVARSPRSPVCATVCPSYPAPVPCFSYTLRTSRLLSGERFLRSIKGLRWRWRHRKPLLSKRRYASAAGLESSQGPMLHEAVGSAWRTAAKSYWTWPS